VKRRSKQDFWIRCTELPDCRHVPRVGFICVNGTFACQDVEWRKFEIGK
jgi:hypothetical protein